MTPAFSKQRLSSQLLRQIMSMEMHKLHVNNWLVKGINRPPNISLGIARITFNSLYSDGYKDRVL